MGYQYSNAPRNNQAQNKRAKDAKRIAEKSLGRKLTEDEWRQVYDVITGQGYDYQDIIDLILEMFG